MSKSPKSGFVAIIGEPNVGKSTLLNAMLGKNADLADRDHILPQHVSEAIQYRSLDRQYWNA